MFQGQISRGLLKGVDVAVRDGSVIFLVKKGGGKGETADA
jgi:hypothetical protein